MRHGMLTQQSENLCHSEGHFAFSVILSPSLPVILNEVKNLTALRTGSAKNLTSLSVNSATEESTDSSLRSE